MSDLVIDGMSVTHGSTLAVDDVVTAARRPDGLRKERKLLVEDLFQRPLGRKEPVAHEQRLLTIADHVAVELPVVVSFRLLGDGARGEHRCQWQRDHSFDTRHSPRSLAQRLKLVEKK